MWISKEIIGPSTRLFSRFKKIHSILNQQTVKIKFKRVVLVFFVKSVKKTLRQMSLFSYVKNAAKNTVRAFQVPSE